MTGRFVGARVVTFGDFELDLESGELSRDGSRVLLAQQPFRLLLLLIREPGGVVTREHLQRELWPEGTFVDFELSLNAAVKRLREALGDSATTPRFVETLPRRGYRFIAPVHDGSVKPAVVGDPRPEVTEPAGSATEAPHAEPMSAPLEPVQPRRAAAVAFKAALVIAATVGLIALTLSRRTPHDNDSGNQSAIRRITSLGTVRLAALSPDGTQLAYVQTDGVRESLWIRGIDDAKPAQLVEPVHGTFRFLSMGAGGFVYYNLFRPTETVSALFRVSAATRAVELVSETASAPSFTRDGSTIGYVATTSMGRRESQLVVGRPDGTDTRVLAVRHAPETFVKECAPAWSPDGTTIAVFATRGGAPQDPQLLLIDARDGHVRHARSPGLVQVRAMQWLPDGTALIVSARERRVSPLRLWHLPSATGVRRPLTHDPSDYTLAGVSADGRRIFAVQENVARSFWAADLSSVEMATRVTVDSGSHGGLEGIAWGADGRLLYSTADADNNVDIWSVDTATNARAQLTRDPAEDYQPTVTVDGRTVAFVSTRSGAPAIWVMAIDGSNPRKLTAGSDTRPFISSDGQWVAFQREAVDTVPVGVWRVPIAGGDSSPVTVQHTIRPAISPDGAHIAHYWMTSQNWMLAVSSVADRQRVGTFPLSPTHLDRVVRWSPDGRALAYIDGAGGVSNIWLQPLDGGAPHKLTNFPEGTITTFDWSRDRSKLAWVRTTEVHDVVSIDLK